MDCINQVSTESILVLKPQRKGSDVSFISSLNNFVTRSLWMVEKTHLVKLAPFNIHNFSFVSLNRSSFSFLKIVSLRVGMHYNVHNAKVNG